jgi:hypothetical protein
MARPETKNRIRRREAPLVWRGHPLDQADGQDITTRIEAAIRP